MYGDYVMLIDHVVGRVVESIEQAGMKENTLIMFSSDNGPVWYDKDIERFGHRSVGPLEVSRAAHGKAAIEFRLS